MNILIINAGSSSLKYQLIDMSTETLLAKGLCERIGIEGSNITQKVGEKKYERTLPLPDHAAAFEAVVAALTDAENGVIADMSSIGAVGHRVLHGGADFTASALIDGPVLKAIEDNIPLGPLHNPANLTGILACRKIMPDVPMVAVFDTAFHQTMPRRAYLYGSRTAIIPNGSCADTASTEPATASSPPRRFACSATPRIPRSSSATWGTGPR